MSMFKRPGRSLSRLSDRIGGGGAILEIGDFAGGGILIGSRSFGGTAYALILQSFAPGQSPPSLQWKTSASSTTGADSLTDGLANSNAMNNAQHPAAQHCLGLTAGGVSGWYLPSRDELAQVDAVRDLLPPEAAIAGYRWTSTQFSGGNAYFQSFETSPSGNAPKTGNTAVQAMRRVPLLLVI